MATESTACALQPADIEALLNLPFEKFDQQPGSGWRPLFDRECYAQAAAVLVAYLKRHPDLAERHYILPFHAGQMFAMAGDYDEAIAYMQRGYSKIPSKTIDWNAFVAANIAFLRRDRAGLLEQRSRIDQQPALADTPGIPKAFVGKKMNLDVVDGFIACFDRSYAVAYGDECRAQR